MIISLIVAMDMNMGIGYHGIIPWHLSSDLKRFKKLTLNHLVLMGSKTYQSIGKFLPGRINLVISRKSSFNAPGCYVFNTLTSALDFARHSGEVELFVIGGAEIFKQFLPYADKLYLTKILAICNSDTKFPDWTEDEWELIEQIQIKADVRDDYDSIFLVYKKKN